MHAPVLVTPPATTPVSLIEAKARLVVETVDDDALITGFINAAVDYLDGSGRPAGTAGNGGVLQGRAIMTQTWRQDFDCFEREMVLPRSPVQSITSVVWRAASDGTLSTIAAENYALKTTDGGKSYVRFENVYSFPSGLYESGAIQVTFVAGETAASEAIKTAILMIVGHWYEHREAVSEGSFAEVPLTAKALYGPYRRISC